MVTATFADGDAAATTAEAAFGHTVGGTAYPVIGSMADGRETAVRSAAAMDGILATGRGCHAVEPTCAAAAVATGPETTDRLAARAPTHATTSRDRRGTLPHTPDERLVPTGPLPQVSCVCHA